MYIEEMLNENLRKRWERIWKQEAEDAKGNLMKMDVYKLSEHSRYIMKKCIDEGKIKNDMIYWSHKLPLKDNNRSAMDTDNWDMDEKEKEKIRRYNHQLKKYADVVLDLYHSEKALGNEFILPDHMILLPTWEVFPLREESWKGWQGGKGREYHKAYTGFMNRMMEKDVKRYMEVTNDFRAPEYVRSIFE